jgi:monoamine oxidase
MSSPIATAVGVPVPLPAAGKAPPPAPCRPRFGLGCTAALAVASLAVLASVVALTLWWLGVFRAAPAPPATALVRRVSYDPRYYGDLHPYLYPSERAEYGVTAEWDAVVVGAGLAGLAAARDLLAGGLRKVLVLEARDRPGGRVLSVPFGRGSVELGAQMLPGLWDNPLSALASEYNAPRAATRLAARRVFGPDGALVSGPALSSAAALQASFARSLAQAQAGMEAAAAAGEPAPDVPLATLVDAAAAGKATAPAALLRHSLATPLAPVQRGAELPALSALYHGVEERLAGPDDVSLGGLSRITDGLAANVTFLGGRVLLNAPAVRVEVGDLNATVTTAGGRRYAAQFVICTAPLGVLQADALAFDPPLPPDTAGAIARLGVGLVNAVHLLFEAVFWHADAEYLTILPPARPDGSGHGDFLAMATFSREPMLVWLPSGAMAAAVESMADGAAVEAAMRALRRAYPAAPAAPRSFVVTRWGANPFARGSHSFYAVGASPADRATLAQPVGGSLLFAGEAAAAARPGSMHGALASGRDAAARILAAARFPEAEAAECAAECTSPVDVEVPVDAPAAAPAPAAG